MDFNKKFVNGFLLIFLIIFITFGSIYLFSSDLSSKDKQTNELRIFNWEDYFGETTIQDFEQEYGVKVYLDTFQDEDLAVEVLKQNASKYDLFIVSDDLIDNLIDIDLIQKINIKKIPNLKYVDSFCLERSYNKVNIYAVPYIRGTTGIVLNSKYFPKDGWNYGLLWDEKNTGKIGLLNNPLELISMASNYLGYGLVPEDSFEMNNVLRYLYLQKKIALGYFDLLTLEEMMLNETLIAAQVYEETGLRLESEYDNFEYILPEEGVPLWIDNFVIPSGAKNYLNSMKFIDYVLRPEVSADISNYLMAVSCNKEAEKLIEDDFLLDVYNRDVSQYELFSEYTSSVSLEKLKEDVLKNIIEG
ncbi:spermidine/putrescine ABC transporter substrate-binding protein [archaeon]|nr:spermidine/putrescine ABC transporter substrate-binding protein [archaeon]